MRVSVIIANHDYGRYISRTLTSLFSQSMPQADFEVLVLDDNSKDFSMDLLLPYMDIIRLIRSDRCEGTLAICNEGFRRARGQYIVRVDADDYVHRDFLSIEAMFLEENKHWPAVSCDYYLVDAKGSRLNRGDASKEPIACGVMFRRETLQDRGLYEVNGNIWEDVNFVKRCGGYHIPLPLYRYLQHEDSLTHGGQA